MIAAMAQWELEEILGATASSRKQSRLSLCSGVRKRRTAALSRAFRKFYRNRPDERSAAPFAAGTPSRWRESGHL